MKNFPSVYIRVRPCISVSFLLIIIAMVLIMITATFTSTKSHQKFITGIMFDDVKIKQYVTKYEKRVLSRFGALTRGTIKRSIKMRKKNTVHSRPGEAPFAHQAQFKRHIFFSLQQQNKNVIIGPAKFFTARKNTSGATVPQVLEYGGISAGGKNPAWKSFGWPSSNTTIHTYLKQHNICIVRWGYSASALINKSRKAGDYKKLKRGYGRRPYKTPNFFSPRKGRRVYIQFGTLKTPSQLRKTKDTMIELFGSPYYPQSKIAARPFVNPAFKISKEKLPQIMRQANTS